MNADEQYRAIGERAATGTLASRHAVAVHGNDRSGFLQGLLTNDIRALAPGGGCYAAWLTPQGRMVTDVHVFNLGEMILLDLPADLTRATLQRLDQSLFSEDVRFEDLSQSWAYVAIHGPSAHTALDRTLSGAAALDVWPEYRNDRCVFRGAPAVVARVSQLGVPGYRVYVERSREAALLAALEEHGAPAAGREALDARRIEAGYPLFGIDMGTDTIPLEAGIEDRAISFTKGCYVGQEVIIRVLHRGHGRVARRLMGLRTTGDPPPHGTRIAGGEREIGWVTSAACSPALGTIAMGYVHRDFAVPGVRVDLEMPARTSAVVSGLPMT